MSLIGDVRLDWQRIKTFEEAQKCVLLMLSYIKAL